MNTDLKGRPPRVKDIKRAHELREKQLSVREISWAILHRDDPKTIHRWLTGSYLDGVGTNGDN